MSAKHPTETKEVTPPSWIECDLCGQGLDARNDLRAVRIAKPLDDTLLKHLAHDSETWFRHVLCATSIPSTSLRRRAGRYASRE
jgi:hypothetical protein